MVFGLCFLRVTGAGEKRGTSGRETKCEARARRKINYMYVQWKKIKINPLSSERTKYFSKIKVKGRDL